MVKLGKLWGDARFASLSPLSKLLYCYLISQPSISTLGVLVLRYDKIRLDLDLDEYQDEEWFIDALEELEKFVRYFYDEDYKICTVIVIDHYRSLSKTKLNIKKAINEGKKSKGRLREIFAEIFEPEDFQDTTSFTPPTPSEVSEYALSIGHLVNGKHFVEYYEDNDWYDKNNKKVRNWKAKVKKVWCREANKLETVEGAPKGFEYFYVEIEDGHRIYPTAWEGGLPTHSNHIYAQYLIDEYNESKTIQR